MKTVMPVLRHAVGWGRPSPLVMSTMMPRPAAQILRLKVVSSPQRRLLGVVPRNRRDELCLAVDLELDRAVRAVSDAGAPMPSTPAPATVLKLMSGIRSPAW